MDSWFTEKESRARGSELSVPCQPWSTHNPKDAHLLRPSGYSSVSIMSFRSNQKEKPSFLCWPLMFYFTLFHVWVFWLHHLLLQREEGLISFTSCSKAHKQDGFWGLKQGLWLHWEPWSLLLAAHATISILATNINSYTSKRIVCWAADTLRTNALWSDDGVLVEPELLK